MLLGVDIGTTHCKAGVFNEAGALMGLASRPMLALRAEDSRSYFDPDSVWQTASGVIGDAVRQAGPCRLEAIGVASMAETGLLFDTAAGRPVSALLPWFDTSPAPQAASLAQRDDPRERFVRTGQRLSYKANLARLLWLRDNGASLSGGRLWLSVADYIGYCLTGQFATDYSLAGRSYAFDLMTQQWDAHWLRQLDLDPSIYPPALPSGQPIGGVTPSAAQSTGLRAGTPVAIAGHDHVCAGLAGGAIHPERAFDSMGTAEALLGAWPERPLGDAEFASGLSFGRHVAAGRLYWMGGLSSSGGAIEWLRGLLGDELLSYASLENLASQAADAASGILFLPYLAGSGAPHTDAQVRAAFAGLSARHGRAEIVQAVLEGTAYEMEVIRRAAERALGHGIRVFRAAGGGTRNRRWLQIKADVSGCRIEALAMADATLLGAALVAGIGQGIFADAEAACAAIAGQAGVVFEPRAGHHAAYRGMFEHGYLLFQEPLRQWGRQQAALEDGQ